MTFRAASNIFGCPLCDKTATFIASSWAEVDEPVGGFDYVQIMLDHEHRMTGIHQALKNLQQQADVMEVKTRSGLVEEEKERLGSEPG
jgi:hypothetical protein